MDMDGCMVFMDEWMEEQTAVRAMYQYILELMQNSKDKLVSAHKQTLLDFIIIGSKGKNWVAVIFLFFIRIRRLLAEREKNNGCFHDC